ncbi:isoamylase early set domain-containing protein [Streptomyces sp. NBC_00841]|uniref:isoamylase early set domain-containing protein n=1 Tax=unclassified Streptomyces TaxID=2593676 RepID=UPI0022535CE4|nr:MULTISPECIES: isoamylase early set domain-containing protein [unclassified Streptomyces]MCX4530338.1 isoamylase early set domain-containing protein [Streptomyces sp. NBC_01669]WSA03889.1 isoamylase early set domain-containing protein [Streptomyces sp. NBC_00841]
MLQRTRHKNRTEITFVLSPDHPSQEVSVVGDFNDWRPGAHPLTRRPDGTRAVTVSLPRATRFGFRYLGHGDYWFDEEGADGHDGTNNYVQT